MVGLPRMKGFCFLNVSSGHSRHRGVNDGQDESVLSVFYSSLKWLGVDEHWRAQNAIPLVNHGETEGDKITKKKKKIKCSPLQALLLLDETARPHHPDQQVHRTADRSMSCSCQPASMFHHCLDWMIAHDDVEWLLSLLLTTLARSKVWRRNRPCLPPCN